MKTIITTILATLIALTAQAESACPSTDPNRFAAVLTGANGSGYAEFMIDGGMLHYRLDRASGQLLRNGNAAIDFNQQEGSLPAGADLLDAISSNPSAFTVSAGGLSGRLNGRGSILMTGELAYDTDSNNGRIRTERAANATGVFTLGFVDDDPDADDVRVDYDLMTDSIEDFDGATLVLVGADGNAQDILDMGSADGFSGGRVHGSVRLSRAELAALLEDRSGYSLQLRSPADGTFGGAVSEAVTTFVPAFGRASNGQFASDIRLHNPGSRPVNVFIQYFPNGATNALAGRGAVIRLEAGQSRTIPDAVHTLFGQTSALGSLRVVASSQVVVDSEISSESRNTELGQFVSGLSGCNAVAQGVLTSISSSATHRTNILIGNPGARSAVARFELRSALGTLLDSAIVTLQKHEQLQMPLSALFPNAGNDVRNAAVTMHADTPLFLGASLIVRGSNEARFSTARDLSKAFD